MQNLSKSKLLSYKQCPRRLWLEVHRAELKADSESAQADYDIGNQVGVVAQRMYDPDGQGMTLDAQTDGYSQALQWSLELIKTKQPLFEAAFTANGALSFADVMLPVEREGQLGWRMVEVKSTSGVKDYHRDDVAIQAWVARSAGVPLTAIALAHIDSTFVYPGDGNYQGLLKECDLTKETFGRFPEIKALIAEAQRVVGMAEAPAVTTGSRCTSPFECGFINYCQSFEEQAVFPVQWLPAIRSKELKELITSNPALDMRDVPDELLTEEQLLVKTHTIAGEIYFNARNAAKAFKSYPFPAYFLDFETVMFAVPIWKGTRPYQQIPFQFSLHVMDESGNLQEDAFLDLTGNDPSRPFAETLVKVCDKAGPIFVYNAGFEGTRISELANLFPDLASDLLAIKRRLVDLHPITKANYYNPRQHGSWSIKAVLPAIAPDLSYEALEGVQHGGHAVNAYLKAIQPGTTTEEKSLIERQLLAYCRMDTYAMVRLWQFLLGKPGIATSRDCSTQTLVR